MMKNKAHWEPQPLNEGEGNLLEVGNMVEAFLPSGGSVVGKVSMIHDDVVTVSNPAREEDKIESHWKACRLVHWKQPTKVWLPETVLEYHGIPEKPVQNPRTIGTRYVQVEVVSED